MVTGDPVSTNAFIGLPSSTTSVEMVGPSDGLPFFSSDQSPLIVAVLFSSAF